MRIAVVDDIESDREKLTNMIIKFFLLKSYGEPFIDKFSCAEELLGIFRPALYDIIFLDIHMLKISGIEAARAIRKIDTGVKVFFVSASNNFASESYEVMASGYITKPYDDLIFEKCISRIDFKKIKDERKIILSNGQSLALSSILYSTVSGHYVYIYVSDGNCVKIRSTQKDFSRSILGYPGFVSCNKGMIVNLTAVDKMESDRFIVNNGAQIPISRRKLVNVKKEYSAFKIDK